MQISVGIFMKLYLSRFFIITSCSVCLTFLLIQFHLSLSIVYVITRPNPSSGVFEMLVAPPPVLFFYDTYTKGTLIAEVNQHDHAWQLDCE